MQGVTLQRTTHVGSLAGGAAAGGVSGPSGTMTAEEFAVCRVHAGDAALLRSIASVEKRLFKKGVSLKGG